MHPPYVPAPPPPPEPPKVLRAMPPPKMTARCGHTSGPPNPPLLSFPRRSLVSPPAGRPLPPVPRAPPDAPPNQPLYAVARPQPPPPASAPPQGRAGLLPIPKGNGFKCSRGGPPPPPPLSERDECESETFASRASCAVGVRGTRPRDSQQPPSRALYPQAEVLHFARRHSAQQTARCPSLSHGGDAAPAEPSHLSHGEPPPITPPRELQDRAQNADGRHLHRPPADYSCDDPGFCENDRMGGPRNFPLPQEPRAMHDRDLRPRREHSPVVLVLQSRPGDRGDSREWQAGWAEQRQYETNEDFEPAASRGSITEGREASSRRSRMEDRPTASDLSPRECTPIDLHRSTAGGTSSLDPQIPRWQPCELRGRSYSPHAQSRSGDPTVYPVYRNVPKDKTALPSLSSESAYEWPRLREPPLQCTRRSHSLSPPTGYMPSHHGASLSRELSESLAASECQLPRQYADSLCASRGLGKDPRDHCPRSASPTRALWRISPPAVRRPDNRRPCRVGSLSRSAHDIVRKGRGISPEPSISRGREFHWTKYRRFSDSSVGSVRTPSSRFRANVSPSQKSDAASVWRERSFSQSLSRRSPSRSPRRLPVPIILSAPTASSRCPSRLRSPRCVRNAATNWRSLQSSDSPSRVSREVSRRFEVADTPRPSTGQSSPRHCGFPWHPPSQLTPSPCSAALSRLPPSPITPFGVTGPQRPHGGEPSLPIERRSPQNADSLVDRGHGSDGRADAQKRIRGDPRYDAAPLQPAAPPVVLTVGGGSQRGGLQDTGGTESRPATDRQRRRKQRQQQRRQRARRRQQNQESFTGGTMRESSRDSQSVCEPVDEQDRSSRGNQTVATTASPPLLVHRVSNLSDYTDSDQETERAPGEDRGHDDPWAASLEDIEQHLKKRRTDFGVGENFAHFRGGSHPADTAAEFPAGCQVPSNCDELFLPPWRERPTGSTGRVVYQFELLQQAHLAPPWHRPAAGVSSSPGTPVARPNLSSQASSPRQTQRPLSFVVGRPDGSAGRGRECRLDVKMVSNGESESNLPRESSAFSLYSPPASSTGGERFRAEDIYESAPPSRGPGSSCSSNSSRRTSMSTSHDQDQWRREHTRGSEKSDTWFWANERGQRYLLTPSTRAPTEGEGGNPDSRFHLGLNVGESGERKEESFRRDSDPLRSTRCCDAAQGCWWSEWATQPKTRENRVHEKDGRNMLLPPVQWC
ncbi:conserved hypothetical protein [Neospora caninum Liverpool]|uniref:Uncharacterized protein n=1 Tax=Neospora caninum (strain Liverpool) TaxID=572307 RepID=F0VEY0_NEOCL|nr:conserved hypothetical protein [Neospora caninum Liverpool]CBZ52274.1 conserved hypothetical protein [Neospora caninum Liverpool]CEL66242.1 TPA: hypothetical protein BN1204_020610 [Neospora caninum Liverpool]|eukprot:XP_003882306.1 conserved hypothetical protein [Neospora caninum Liverpool]